MAIWMGRWLSGWMEWMRIRYGRYSGGEILVRKEQLLLLLLKEAEQKRSKCGMKAATRIQLATTTRYQKLNIPSLGCDNNDQLLKWFS